MRGHRESGRFQAIIDLTSLLDVVFIVLLVVICHQQFGEQASESKLEETYQAAQEASLQAEALRSEADNAKQMYEDRLDTLDNITNYVSILTVYADYTPGKPEERFIRILGEGDGEIMSMALNDRTEDEAFSLLSDTLRAEIEGAEGRTVILSVNLDRILYRDEAVVENIFADLDEIYDNIIYKRIVIR